MYNGVPTIWPKCVNSVCSVSVCVRCLGDAEVDDLGHRKGVVERDQHVGGLEVAVDDALLVGVLHGLADGDEQLQPLPRREPVLVAVLGDGHALDQLHDEVGPARFGLRRRRRPWRCCGWSMSARACRSASKRATTCRVSMPGLMTFRATRRRTGCSLLGHEDQAHAAFADLLQQLVGADHRARPLARLKDVPH